MPYFNIEGELHRDNQKRSNQLYVRNQIVKPVIGYKFNDYAIQLLIRMVAISWEEPKTDYHFSTNPYSSIETVVPFNYKYLMIGFLVIKYAWEQYINFRQLRKNLIKSMPVELTKYRISQNEFLLSQSYSFDKITFQMLALSVRMAVDVLSIACNLLPFIWDNVQAIIPFISVQSEFQRAVAYTLIEAFKSKAFEVPISAYKTFVIQKKYNFTNKTIQLFMYDIFVQATLMLIIFPPIIYGYLKVVNYGGQDFYIFLQVFVLFVTIILTWVHPNLIAPLFNKFTELKDQELRQKIFMIAEKNSVKISNIYVINSSVRSAHLNAYLYGLGMTKVIVLYDSLLVALNKQQVLSVISHEIGHSYYSHSFQKLVVYLLEVFFMFWIFAQFIKNQSVFISFGFTTRSVFICTALYFHMFEPLTSVFNTLLLVITRKFEFQADTFACQQGYGEHLKSSLMKLFKQSTSTVRPDYLYAWIKHSHPSIYERIENIQSKSQKNRKKYDDAYREKNKSKNKPAVVNQPRSQSYISAVVLNIRAEERYQQRMVHNEDPNDDQSLQAESESYSSSGSRLSQSNFSDI